jgi:elongation factor 1-gamma
METVLTTNEFLVGSELTLADVAAASVLVLPFKVLFDKQFRNNFKKVTEWFTKITQLP